MNEEFDEQLAQDLRQIYIEERRDFHRKRGQHISASNYKPSPQWDGGKNSRGYKFKPIWPKIAAVVAENALDPRLFVRACFEAADKYAPEPNILLSKSALDNYQKHSAEGGKYDLNTSLALAKEVFKSRLYYYVDQTDMEQADILTAVLFDETLQMSPLFRYCMSIRFDLIPVRKEYFKAAVLEYVRDREEYDRCWSDVLPESLRTNADSYYQRIIGNGGSAKR